MNTFAVSAVLATVLMALSAGLGYVIGYSRGRRVWQGKVHILCKSALPLNTPLVYLDRLEDRKHAVVLTKGRRPLSRIDRLKTDPYASAWMYDFGAMEVPGDCFYLTRDPDGNLMAFSYAAPEDIAELTGETAEGTAPQAKDPYNV